MVTDFNKLKVNLNFKIKVKHKTRAPAIKQDKVLTNLIQHEYNHAFLYHI